MTMSLAEDMIGDLWEKTNDDDGFFAELSGLPGLPPPPVRAPGRSRFADLERLPSPPPGANALSEGLINSLGGDSLFGDSMSSNAPLPSPNPLSELSSSQTSPPAGGPGLPPPLPQPRVTTAAWPSLGHGPTNAASSSSHDPTGRARSGSGTIPDSLAADLLAMGLPPPTRQPTVGAPAPTAAAVAAAAANKQAGKQVAASSTSAAAVVAGGNKQEEVPMMQDPTKEWRCKCGTINKVGTHLCASRSCHCYFCLGCGQLGHQQKFCRRAPSAAAAAATTTTTPVGGPTLGKTTAVTPTAPAPAPVAAASSSQAAAGGDDKGRPVQNPKAEWRCKCGTINKPGAYQCAKRGCRVFFCLACGQLGHQQKFCRQVGASGAPPASSPPAVATTAAAAPAIGGLPPPRTRRGRQEQIVAEQLAEAGDANEGCVVCLDAPAQVTLFPCGHNITCASCTRALLQLKRPCPFCSAPIKNTDLDRLPEAWRMA